MNATLEGPNRDIAAARTLYEQIRNVLKAYEQGERSNAMPQDLKVLCISLMHTIRDPYCQEKISEVAIHADKLFAIDERTRLGSSMLPIFLRRLILKSLEAIDDRLTALETTQSHHGAARTGEARSLHPLQARIRRTPTLPPAPAARS